MVDAYWRVWYNQEHKVWWAMHSQQGRRFSINVRVHGQVRESILEQFDRQVSLCMKKGSQ